MELKIELMKLKKTQKDLIAELQNNGIKVTPAEMSIAINGIMNTPKGKMLVTETEKIIERWKVDEEQTDRP